MAYRIWYFPHFLILSLKETAVRAVPGLYGLNGIESKQIAKRVEDWLDREAYILPQRNNAKPDFLRPFHHQAIISVLRDEYFQKLTSFGNANLELFVSAHETSTEPEIPDAMVALVATAVYCALAEWRTGKRVSASFTQAGYEDVYRGHVSMLQELRNQHPNQCHRIMSALFDTVTDSHSHFRSKPTASSSTSYNLKMLMQNLDHADEE
ncbi:hypothetical protein BJV77DRAFT_1068369 [Russula vinacea]|nr:hypothetical protein BJV77DRAFT_1068369 [Russula vinacea]